MSYITEFICGCMSGWAQVVTMQPFEIIKVRLVNQSLHHPLYDGMVDCFSKIYQEEGIKAFYKGTLTPLIGNGGQVAMQFGTNQIVKKVLMKYGSEQQDQKLAMDLIFLSGIITGIPSSLVVTPVDHTRIKMQNKETRYSSSINAGIQIMKNHGIKGLYHGLFPTMLRQIIALGVYFSSYQATTRFFTSQKPSALLSFFSGGISGCLSWAFTYPIDYLKTLIQSDCLQRPKYASTFNAALIKYKQEGIKTFFKGLNVTLLRAFPVNGVGFLTFQYFRKQLSLKEVIV